MYPVSSQDHCCIIPQSPVGILKVVASDEAITALCFCETAEEEHPSSLALEAKKQLLEYFEKRRTVFDLPVSPAGTAFQKTVWQALQTIPYGTTVSYLSLSRQIGNEKAIRAVGRANGQNPIPLIIPCHRVIGSDGSLVGYGGGLWRKKQLLKLEGLLLQQELAF